MLGLFGLFGRSQDMQRLDDAFRAVGLRTRGVPDAVKLTTLKQLKEAGGGVAPDIRACITAAELLGYCVLGREEFVQANGPEAADRSEERLMAAIASGYGLDARLVLLTMHAGLVHQGVVERFDLKAE